MKKFDLASALNGGKLVTRNGLRVDITIPENEIIGKPMEDYIRAKHTQEECIGFIDGWNAAKEKLYTAEDIFSSWLYSKGLVLREETHQITQERIKFEEWLNSKKK